ncbi:MAG: hypothetical protein ACTSO7_08735 [Candidatus Heimdallarchaeota archaeon]
MIVLGKGNDRAKMRKLGIVFLVFAFIGTLFVTLAPFSHLEFDFNDSGIDYEYDLWLFFNGRLKISLTIDGVIDSVTLGDAIWLELEMYPTANVVLIAVGIGLVLLGGLYKSFIPLREDKRVFTFLVILGGGLGLAGTLLFPNFNNNSVFPVPDLAWGYYCAIVIFSLFILVGVISIYGSIKNPIAIEEDTEEQYTDLLK